MRNPCTRDCPDREPGCNCEKRKAWKFLRAQARDAKERLDSPHWYLRDTAHRLRRRGYFPKNK